MNDKILNRRKIIKNAIIGTGALASAKIFSSTNANTCGTTPSQTEGPFYPVSFKIDQDNDLTHIKTKLEQAKGEVVFIEGIVSDESCRPIEGAIVEIWQACDSGRYNHPSDPNPAKLDPNFQYYGRSISDKFGRYGFKTIIPGEYKATETWIRPPHIHVKVSLRGYHELTTQMYFKGNQHNKTDRILKSLSKTEQEKVIIEFKKTRAPHKTGTFNISLPSF